MIKSLKEETLFAVMFYHCSLSSRVLEGRELDSVVRVIPQRRLTAPHDEAAPTHYRKCFMRSSSCSGSCPTQTYAVSYSATPGSSLSCWCVCVRVRVRVRVCACACVHSTCNNSVYAN